MHRRQPTRSSGQPDKPGGSRRRVARHASRWIAASAALLFVSGIISSVSAQCAPAAKPNAEVKFRKTSQLSAAEQLRQAGKYILTMQKTQHAATKLADRARVEKDIIKLNCVNDKLIQIKGNLRVAESAREALKSAASRGNEGDRNHQFSKLTIIFQKVTVLGQEAEQCIGDELAYVGKTKVEVQVDPDIPQTDPTTAEPLPFDVVRPPVASPFL